MPTPVLVCPNCDTLNPVYRRDCRDCGHSLADVQPVDTETLSAEMRDRGAALQLPLAVPKFGARAENSVRTRADHSGMVLTGVDIPFTHLVKLMVLLAFASIPAAIIIAAVWFLVAAVIFGGASL